MDTIGALSSFSPTNTDLVHNNTASCQIGIDSISDGTITAMDLWLSAIRTYVSDCYLVLTRGSATASTATFSNNSSTHSELVNIPTFNQDWLSVGAGTLSIQVKRTGGGSSNAINFRDGCYGELGITFNTNEKVKIKINGTWRNGKIYIKIDGVWKEGTPYIKVNGEWKEGLE